ncbi:MAG: hypothetical protein JNL52_15415 [Flavobacteriales bacterium]|nr:hypothetical protein [Flavobacteriales bacterium]
MNDQLNRSWRNVPQLLKRILWFSVASIVVILVLRLWPECFSLGEEVGDLLSNISLAYVGGFIVTFLWSHFQALSEVARAAELRQSAIQFMEEAHNCFYDFIISGTGSASSDSENYSLIDAAELEERTRARWDEFRQGIQPEQQLKAIEVFQESALEMFKEHFEEIGPFLSHFHPTFVVALNRIRRELDHRVIVGRDGVPAVGHELSGPLMQFAAIRRHIQWLREVDAQIARGASNDFLGAVPILSREELIARGVPAAMLDRMERSEV